MTLKFLAPADLKSLTGYKRPKDCKRWLEERFYPFEIGADGWPRVLWSVVEARMGENKPERREPMLRVA